MECSLFKCLKYLIIIVINNLNKHTFYEDQKFFRSTLTANKHLCITTKLIFEVKIRNASYYFTTKFLVWF